MKSLNYSLNGKVEKILFRIDFLSYWLILIKILADNNQKKI